MKRSPAVTEEVAAEVVMAVAVAVEAVEVMVAEAAIEIVATTATNANRAGSQKRTANNLKGNRETGVVPRSPLFLFCLTALST
jgi:hypothetical protein